MRPRIAALFVKLYKSIRGSNDLLPALQVLRMLTSSDDTDGSRVVPRGSTVRTCVPCVSATVLFPTETVVVSGNPWLYCQVPLSQIWRGSSYTPDIRYDHGTSLPTTPRRKVLLGLLRSTCELTVLTA